MRTFSRVVTLLVRRTYAAPSVIVQWNPHARKLSEELIHAIEQNWMDELAIPARKIFNGKLCRLDSFTANDKTLRLNLGLTNYQELLYSNKFTREIISRYGRDGLAAALGISAVVTSADNKLVLMQRSQTVGECPGRLDVFGGHIDADIDNPNFHPDPFQAISLELKEELNLDAMDYHPPTCIGLIRTVQTQKPELIFLTRLNLPAQELRLHATNARDADEYNNIIFLNDTVAELNDYLNNQFELLAPSALGCLWLYAKKFLDFRH